MNENAHLLSCVIIPMGESQLLLPNVSIAEVVDYARIEPRESMPDWLAGDLEWRGLTLPALAYDAANGSPRPAAEGSRSRIAILNTISDQQQAQPFIALVTQGIPSQIRVTRNQIRAVEGDTGPADLMLVDIEGEAVRIPNLDYLESLAREAAH
ncbi:chemotaxis protein CheW [Marinobacter sp. X15-166B]|uniref:chemotaxis protein CheW n=1 Tax=Marinobacter sp. X15-166B TaxID=1897620 RepID=UPI00085C9A5F|nr:chemotaxis protein CheW [Marinobacter sp. X15-166B]OEY65863.1 chemotaxis protein CheW [Marinobacter sp. X15-166B]